MSPTLMHRPFGLGIRRGAIMRCPNCGKGHLYRKYLKVAPCAACGHDNTAYPADDAPPYFTILLVGHLIVAPLLLFPWIWEERAEVVLGVTLPLLAIITLALLPVVKGAVVGLQWSLRHSGDPSASPHIGPGT